MQTDFRGGHRDASSVVLKAFGGSCFPPAFSVSRPTPAWDAVIVLVDHDPVESVVQLHAATGGATLPADFAAARQELQPILAMYKKFYGFWADSALNGATLTMIVDPLGGGDPAIAAQEMLKLREVGEAREAHRL